jgi:hypothetical protein
MAENMKDTLTRHVRGYCLENGYFSFNHRTTFSEWRIDSKAMYAFVDGWSQLAADLVLEAPTAGVIGVVQEGEHWIQGITKALANRGVELPTTEIQETEGSIDNVWGVPLADYPKHPVTIFTNINTLGGNLDFQVRWMRKQGIEVNRTIALIDRSPTPMTETLDEHIPFAAVVHLPLPLYSPDEETMYQKFEFLPSIPTRWRQINTVPLLS